MIGKIKKGKSFGGCIRYVMGKDDAKILESDGGSAGSKFLLATLFLQPAGLRICAALASAVVGDGVGHDPANAKGSAASRMAADPVSAVADLCRISEFCHLSAQPIKKEAVFTASFCVSESTILCASDTFSISLSSLILSVGFFVNSIIFVRKSEFKVTFGLHWRIRKNIFQSHHPCLLLSPFPLLCRNNIF